MFAFVNANTPFRDLKLMGDSVLDLLSLRRHTRVLASATKVEWNSGVKSWRPPISTKRWTVVGLSFRFMLSALQTSTSLRTLQLVGVKVKPSHQLMILSTPTLKTLILQLSHFVPTAIKMPLSSITSLTLVLSGRRACLEHTLGIFRDTLETLEVGYLVEDIYPVLEKVHLHRLTGLEQWGFDIRTSGFGQITPHTSSTITKLCITTWSYPRPLVLPDGVFPHLRELFSPWWIGTQLVPGRPVQVFYGIDKHEIEFNELQTNLALLSQSTRGIEELQLYTLLSIPRLLLLLAMHVPRLQQLHLWNRVESLLAESLELQRTPNEGRLNTLTEIHVRSIGTWFQIREPACRMLSATRSWICPILEVAKICVGEIIAVPGEKWAISSQRELKLRRIHTGEWEELM